MGGIGFVFTGQHDADIMPNFTTINFNCLEYGRLTGVRKFFYSSSACMYPESNQLDPNNPKCSGDGAYPAAPDSEFGWKKLFSGRLCLCSMRNHGVQVRISRFHNIFGPRALGAGIGKRLLLRSAAKSPRRKTGKRSNSGGRGADPMLSLYR